MIFEINLSEDARFDLERFMQARRLSGQSSIIRSAYKPVRCQFKNQVPQQRRAEYEQINQFHPLTQFVSESIQEKIRQSKIVHFPTVSLCLNHKAVPTISPQDYLFYVERWTVKGVKEIERMVYCARPAMH